MEPMELYFTKDPGRPSDSDYALTKEEFVEKNLPEIIGNRNANGVPTTKADVKRLRWSLRVDWELFQTD